MLFGKAPKKTKQTDEHPLMGLCRIPLPSSDPKGKLPSLPVRMHEITWRIFRIMAEFVEGFEFLSQFKREVTIFGSARFTEENHWYKEAQKLGHMMADCGFTVITGGGPGIMEAANRGAHEGGGQSVGLNIQLPMEQRTNPYVNKSRAFHYFFTRKVMLAASAQAYIFFPGGFGTADEMFEMVTLIQTGKMEPIPVILVGKSFWDPLVAWIDKTMVETEHTVSPVEEKIFHVVDTAEEAFSLIQDTQERSFF